MPIKHPLNVEAIAQHDRCASRASLTTPAACPPSATRAACVYVLLENMWLRPKPAPTSRVLETLACHPPSRQCAIRGWPTHPPKAPPRTPPPAPPTRCSRSLIAASSVPWPAPLVARLDAPAPSTLLPACAMHDPRMANAPSEGASPHSATRPAHSMQPLARCWICVSCVWAAGVMQGAGCTCRSPSQSTM